MPCTTRPTASGPIHTRHEQGAAYLALGAAMATGKPSAYCVVPGPGFLNTTGALSQAYGNNAPVLAIAGQVPLAYVNRDTGYLHDIPDQLGIMQRLTKWSARIRAPHEAACHHRRGVPADGRGPAAPGGHRMPPRRVGQAHRHGAARPAASAGGA